MAVHLTFSHSFLNAKAFGKAISLSKLHSAFNKGMKWLKRGEKSHASSSIVGDCKLETKRSYYRLQDIPSLYLHKDGFY